MKHKVDMSVSYDNEQGYMITFDEGLIEEIICHINNQDTVSINYGNSIYSDYKETKKRRKQIIKEMLFDELVGKKNTSILEQEEFYFEGIFKKFEKYIIDNDIFVEEYGMLFSTEEEYQALVDEETEVITILINDKRITDIFGISINKDNSFEFYIKRSKDELTKTQIDFLQNSAKDFIKRKLNIMINFGRDLNGPLKIKGLYDAALKLVEYQTYEDSEIESVTYDK